MTGRGLQVTYRRGRPFAANLYFSGINDLLASLAQELPRR
jgi:hypothetical protein